MKLSPAFTTLLHIVWSGIFGLIIGGGTAVIQYNTTHGINLEQDAMLFALTVLTGLGSTAISILHNVQASPALPQAEAEVESAIATEAKQLAQDASNRIDQVIVALQSHFQDHAVQDASQKAAVPSSLRPVQLQPIAADSTPVAPPAVPSVPNVAPAGAVPSSTIPAMPAVLPQQ